MRLSLSASEQNRHLALLEKVGFWRVNKLPFASKVYISGEYILTIQACQEGCRPDPGRTHLIFSDSRVVK
jgi:hypothetical protein